MSDTLPLFPLSQMPMPGTRLPLQIFEPRYLDMIRQQMKAQAGFGVVQIERGGEVGRPPTFFAWGVEVAIVDWDQLPNGLLGITIEGRAPFRVCDHALQGDGLLVAKVVRKIESETAVALYPQWDGLVEILQQLKSYPGIEQLQLPDADTGAKVVWQLLQLLPVSHAQRQQVLALDDTLARLAWLARSVDQLAHG